MKKLKKEKKRQATRKPSATIQGMSLRHPHSGPHRHRTAPRGGDRNLQATYRSEDE